MNPQIWFTSDEHYNHENIIKFCNRPFRSVEEMNNEIIRRHNLCVKSGDEVWHLGDFAWSNAAGILKNLNGRKHHLCLGNHDKKHIKQELGLFDSVQDVAQVRWMGERVFLSHYSHARWPSSGRGRIHLFGHSHGTFEGLGLSIDVGVDAWSFQPISFEQVLGLLRVPRKI